MTKFTIEELKRGGKEVLVVLADGAPRGSIEMANYEEKVAWTKALDTVNSILNGSLQK